MNLFVESSAIVAWLFDEPPAGMVKATFGAAKVVVASELALVEARRVIVRAEHERLIEPDAARWLRHRLLQVSDHWVVVALTDPILDRASRPFPVEPVRTLDAIHLASALETHLDPSTATILTLDHRIRDNAIALGFEVARRA